VNARRLAPWFTLAAVATLVLLAIFGRDDDELPALGQVPAFQVTDHHGEALTAADLRGKTWVANFMFTRCPDVCPLLTEHMLGLWRRLDRDRPKLRFVSFSVDPKHDTPEVLAKYADEHGANRPGWFFVTGELEAVRKVVVEGFHQSMQRIDEPGKPMNVLHGSHFVLVDAQGAIRGYYRSDTQGLREIARDATRLARQR
jgi:protein SCO1/2